LLSGAQKEIFAKFIAKWAMVRHVAWMAAVPAICGCFYTHTYIERQRERERERDKERERRKHCSIEHAQQFCLGLWVGVEFLLFCLLQ